MNIKKNQFFIIILFIGCFNNSFAQYQMSLTNDVQTSTTEYEFDVFVKSTLGTIDLTSYQLVFTFNKEITNGGNLSFSYLSGSSALSNPPTIGVGITNDGGIQNLTAGSNPGYDYVSTSNVKIGRFKITNTVPFSIHMANVAWDFAGGNATEVNISSHDATNVDNHVLGTYTFIEAEVIPNKYELYQNYPNPFNPVTNIKFSLPVASRVKIDIFNILGEKVKTLIAQDMEAGLHAVTFNAENLTSGTYIYRLQTESFKKIKQMLLLK
jgi:hypothetical protein